MLTKLEADIYESTLKVNEDIDKEVNKAEAEIEKAIAVLWLISGNGNSKYNKTIAEIDTILSNLQNSLESILTDHFNKANEVVADKLKDAYKTSESVSTPIWKYPNGETYKTTLLKLKKVSLDSIVKQMKAFNKLGWKIDELQKKIQKELNKINRTIKTINRTDVAYVQNKTALEMFKKVGYKQFKFVAIIDDRTTELCLAMNGKVFPVSQAEIGVNVPPLHYCCRSHIEPIEEPTKNQES